MAESTCRRAWKDTERFRRSTLFFWGCEALGAVLFGVGGALLLPEQPSRLASVLYPGLGTVAGLATVFVVVFIWNLFRAPYRQRNEARELTKEYQDQIKEIDQKYTNEINKLQKKLVDPILQEKQREHLDEIKNSISNWMESLSIPRISEVWPSTTSGTDNVRNSVRFPYLKEHLPFRELWQNFNDWDSNIEEYLNKCKGLRSDIKESWKIEFTQATPSFADPILKMIDGGKLDFNFRITYDPEFGEEEVSRQTLIENGIEVVHGTLVQYAKIFKELGHYRCLYLTLGKEYQELANEFLNQPLIAEVKQLSSSLITISSNIQESLRQILEKAEYIKHSCKDCPIREQTT